MIKVISGDLPGTLVLVPDVFADARGLVMEAYNERDIQHAKASTGVYHFTALGSVTRYDYAHSACMSTLAGHGKHNANAITTT
jgi:hypothetical protein